MIDGLKVEFIPYDTYFSSLATDSMGAVAKETGADVVCLLSKHVQEEDVTDGEIRNLLEAAKEAKKARHD